MIKNLLQKIKNIFQSKSHQAETISDVVPIADESACIEIQTDSKIQTDPSPSSVCSVEEDPPQKMNKHNAVSLLRQNGHVPSGVTTFASKNKTTPVYWANPSFDVLNEQWNLILNDWINRELHLFIIPAHTIAAQRLVCRADKPYQIDLQIMYGDSSFTDMRSKMSFAQFLTQSLKY